MSDTIIIIESPNKKDKIQKISGFDTYATTGHFKALPQQNYLNYETYEPTFEFTNEKKKQQMNYIFSQCKGKEVIIATDPDREGYAIGFMFYLIIKNIAKSIKRAEFHEITENGIKKGLNSAIEFTKTNFNEFEAFKARAVGDKLVGFLLSPKYINLMSDKNVSIGRVQTPALNLIVTREKEIQNFNALPESEKLDYKVKAKLEKDGLEFFVKNDTLHKTKQEAQDFIDFIKDTQNAILQNINTKESKKAPPAPFRTSQLQEKANKLYGFGSDETMRYAQSLFENGLITYIRTDSNSISEDFINEVESFFGKESWYQRREYKAGKQSQAEAHEAIRITHIHKFEEIDSVISKANADIKDNNSKLKENHKKLYTMIYLNSVLSQAKDCINEIKQYEFLIKSVIFTTSTSAVKFKGFKDVFVKENEDEDEVKNDDEAKIDLSKFQQNDNFAVKGYEISEVKKSAPSRFKESNFISLLEKEGIGRPSTYAMFLPTLLKRQYIEKQGKKAELVPTPKGFKVIEFLQNNNDGWITESEFTRIMEEALDKISENKTTYLDYIKPLHAKMNFAKSESPSGERKPSPKQIEFLQKLAKEQNIEISQEICDDYAKCQEMIDKLKKSAPAKPPSEKQRALAESLAQSNNLELPANYDKDYKICSAFIDKVFATSKKGQKNAKK